MERAPRLSRARRGTSGGEGSGCEALLWVVVCAGRWQAHAFVNMKCMRELDDSDTLCRMGAEVSYKKRRKPINSGQHELPGGPYVPAAGAVCRPAPLWPSAGDHRESILCLQCKYGARIKFAISLTTVSAFDSISRANALGAQVHKSMHWSRTGPHPHGEQRSW